MKKKTPSPVPATTKKAVTKKAGAKSTTKKPAPKKTATKERSIVVKKNKNGEVVITFPT